VRFWASCEFGLAASSRRARTAGACVTSVLVKGRAMAQGSCETRTAPGAGHDVAGGVLSDFAGVASCASASSRSSSRARFTDRACWLPAMVGAARLDGGVIRTCLGASRSTAEGGVPGEAL
jgi:hypothetical protein